MTLVSIDRPGRIAREKTPVDSTLLLTGHLMPGGISTEFQIDLQLLRF
jgi:hypothetical protein